jgi:hypothetical protein
MPINSLPKEMALELACHLQVIDLKKAKAFPQMAHKF